MTTSRTGVPTPTPRNRPNVCFTGAAGLDSGDRGVGLPAVDLSACNALTFDLWVEDNDAWKIYQNKIKLYLLCPGFYGTTADSAGCGERRAG